MGTRRYRTRNPRRTIRAAKSSANNVHQPNDKDLLSVDQHGNVVRSLNEAIEIERDNLSKADSVLGCLVIAMEYGSDARHTPYFPDVAQIARNLVQQSLRGLDAVTLQQRLRNKVKDEIHIRLWDFSAEIHAPLVSSAPGVWRRRSGRTLRLHRREYGSARKEPRSLQAITSARN
jgi:hypothetical protein